MNASRQPRKGAGSEAAAYAVGLVVTCGLLWLAYAAVTSEAAMRPRRELGASVVHAAAWLWFVPMAYLLAWSILAIRSLPEAGRIVTMLGVANLALAGLATALGLLTGGMLAPFAIVGAAWCSGMLLAVLHPASAANGIAVRWRRIHRHGALAAGFGLTAAAFTALGPGTTWSSSHYVTTGVILGLSFAPHAVMSWRQLRAEGITHRILPRAAALMALAYCAPAGLLAGMGRAPGTAAWPLGFLAARDAQHAADVQRQSWGGEERGRILPPGERVTLRIGADTVTASAPPGWRMRADEPRVGTGALPGWFLLRRDGEGSARAPGLVTRIEVGRPWTELRILPSPGSATPEGRPARWPHVCVPVAGDGLIRCRSVPDRRALDAATAARAALVDFLPHAPEGGFLAVVGPGFRAGCIEQHDCIAQFRVGAGAAVAATFPARHLARWRDLRAEVDAVIRATIGRGLDDGPGVLLPEEGVLVLGSS